MSTRESASTPCSVISWAITESPSGEATLTTTINDSVKYTVRCKSKTEAAAVWQKLNARLRAAEQAVPNG